MYMQYNVEAQDMYQLAWGTSDAKPATLSFWAKSNTAGTYVVSLAAYDGTDLDYYTAPYDLDGSGSWQYITIVIPANTITQVSNTTANTTGLFIKWPIQSSTTYSSGTPLTEWAESPSTSQLEAGQTADIGAAVNNYWQITGIQLEVGPATPFEHRSYGEELALCQRYYEVLYADSEAAANVSAFSTTSAYGHMKMQPKRAAPTMLVSAATTFRVRSAGNNLNLTAIGFNDPTATGNVRVNCTTGGLVAGDSGWLSRTSNGTAYIHADAEL